MQNCTGGDVEIACCLVVRPTTADSQLHSTRPNVYTHICLPLKINLCCCGGTPDCSSTFSLILVIWIPTEG